MLSAPPATGPRASADSRGRGPAPYALDLEDFHTAEQPDDESGRLANALAGRIESTVLPGAAFLTAASRSIAEAYGESYALAPPLTINNTFPLPAEPPSVAPTPGPGLRLYWFSQTVGPGRGLEEAVRSIGLADIPAELHLRGRPSPGYLESLTALASEVAPRLGVVRHAPAAPDAMVPLAHGYDVGLALEPGTPRNNGLALSNKAFTYMLAGVAVAFTDTPGQRSLARDLGEGALLYAPGDVEALAAGLRRWADDREALGRARATAWEAARRRWHWEHPEERGVLLEAVAKVLGR